MEKIQKNRIKIPSSSKNSPYIVPFLLKNETKSPLVLVIPGGGYDHYGKKEQESVALKMNELGFSAAILYYTLAPTYFPQQLIDLADTVAYIRQHEAEWNIQKICLCGFSAGAHLGASLGCYWNSLLLKEYTNWSAQEIRPDFIALCYPVITAQNEFCNKGSIDNLVLNVPSQNESKKICTLCDSSSLKDAVSLEKHVSADFPPAFIWHTQTDESVPPYNSLIFASELLKAKVSVEYHLFPEGKHGLALAENTPCKIWPEFFKTWLNSKIQLDSKNQ